MVDFLNLLQVMGQPWRQGEFCLSPLFLCQHFFQQGIEQHTSHVSLQQQQFTHVRIYCSILFQGFCWEELLAEEALREPETQDAVMVEEERAPETGGLEDPDVSEAMQKLKSQSMEFWERVTFLVILVCDGCSGEFLAFALVW